MAMEEPVCEIDEDALDAALDMELAATYIKHPAPTPNVTEEPPPPPTTASQLTFAFPGWEIGISKSSKLQTPSVSRIEPQSTPTKKAKHAESVGYTPAVEGCPADAMDDDLLASVLARLNVKELCACMRTCKRWHRVACREDVWAHVPLPGTPIPGALPRWMEIRNAGLSMDLRIRFQVFRRGYEFVRSALNAWWDHEKPDSNHPTAIFRSLTQKLVINDWSLLYEAFGAAFSDRADRVAVVVLATIQRIELKRWENGVVSNLPDVWDEDEVQEVWVLVLEMWRRFKRWLMLVVSHCPELNHEVMAERARSNALATTPTVYGKGIICFRSQVILKYGIRSVLQATWSGLATAKRSGTASDNQLDLFRSADHLFQETSTVLDDLTLSPTTFTQQKLRRCFGSETSTKTKPRGKPTPTALS